MLFQVALNSVQIQGQDVLVDNWLINREVLSLEPVILVQALLNPLLHLIKPRVHLLGVKVGLVLAEAALDHLVALGQGLGGDVGLEVNEIIGIDLLLGNLTIMFNCINQICYLLRLFQVLYGELDVNASSVAGAII